MFMTTACLNDKVRIKSGDLAGARGIVLSCKDERNLQLRLVKDCWRASNIPQACAPSEYSGNAASLE